MTFNAVHNRFSNEVSFLPFIRLSISHNFRDFIFVYRLSFVSKITIGKYLLCSLVGVWPEGSDGTDINALVRSHNRKVIAVADDFCKVHLFQYPCSKPKVSLDQSSLCACLHCMKLALPDTCFQLGHFGTWQPNDSLISENSARDKSMGLPIQFI